MPQVGECGARAIILLLSIDRARFSTVSQGNIWRQPTIHTYGDFGGDS